MIVFTDMSKEELLESISYVNQSEPFSIAALNTLKIYNDIPHLFGLFPDYKMMSNEALQDTTTPLFEQEYANYLMGQGFLFLMTLVALEYYSGDVIHYYLISKNNFLQDSLIESLQRFLFYRYGIESCIASSAEDLYTTDLSSSFSVMGLISVCNDIDRVMQIDPRFIEGMMS